MKFNIFLFFIFSLLLFGCQKPVKTGLSYDIKEKNYALLFTMTDESGRTKNLQLMEDCFKDLKFGFLCEKFHNLSSKQIYEKVAEYTPKVGENGTLLLYLNSHGGGSGKNFMMQAREGSFKFSKLIKSIASSGKVKRLVVLIDTCHAAGGIEEGFESKGEPIRVTNIEVRMPELIPDSYFRNFFDIKNNTIDYCMGYNAYSEALIVASCSPEKLAIRGVFAYNFKKAKEKVAETATVAEFLRTFSGLHTAGQQIPYFKCLPNNSILNEPLFYNPVAREIPMNGNKDEILLPDFKFN